jgi:hypothetical protein
MPQKGNKINRKKIEGKKEVRQKIERQIGGQSSGKCRQQISGSKEKNQRK